jgi:DNA-binding transcriptional LysR family regulator
MTINSIKLQIIEELYKHKKITTVAEQLNLKQPTITFHLKNLEKELGVKLFESRSGKIILTEAGDCLYHYALKINALTQEAVRVVQEYDLGRGTLKIGASYVPATYLLPRILAGFAKLNSKITLSLTVKTAPAILKMLENHEIDLGIMSSEPIESSSLKGEPLCEDELVFFFSPHHRLAEHDVLSPDKLNGLPFILHGQESNTRSMTLKWFKSNNLILNAQMELDSLEAIKQIVLCGESISVISRLAIHNELELGKLTCRQIPQNTFRRFIYCAYNLDRKKSSLLDSFTEYLKVLTKAAIEKEIINGL